MCKCAISALCCYIRLIVRQIHRCRGRLNCANRTVPQPYSWGGKLALFFSRKSMQSREEERRVGNAVLQSKGSLSLKSQVYFCLGIEVLSGVGGVLKGRDQPQPPFVKRVLL